MNYLGFYVPVQLLGLDVAEFAKRNLMGFFQKLVPHANPDVEILRNRADPHTFLMCYGYNDAKQRDEFAINVPMLNDQLTRYGHRSPRAMICIWGAIFHELRHFVQQQLPLAKEVLFSDDSFAKLPAEASEYLQMLLSRCRKDDLPNRRLLEADALFIETICVYRLIRLTNGFKLDAEFNQEELIKTLLISSDNMHEGELRELFSSFISKA